MADGSTNEDLARAYKTNVDTMEGENTIRETYREQVDAEVPIREEE